MERMCPSGPWNELLEAEHSSHTCCAFLRVAERIKTFQNGTERWKKRNYFCSWEKTEKVRERPWIDLYFHCQWSQDGGRILIYTPIWFLPQVAAADRSPPGGLDSVKAAFSHGKYFLPEHFWLTSGTSMKGSDSGAAVTSSINSTEAVEGQQGAEDTAPGSPGDAEHGQPCLQLWPPQISVMVRALGLAGSSMGLGSICPRRTCSRGRAGPVPTFSLFLIRLMGWPEMLTGLELSRVTKHLGFAFVQIPAAHWREMAASDLQAARTLHWGGVFSPRSAATAWPDMFLMVSNTWCVVSGIGTSLWSWLCWALLPLSPGRCQLCGHLSSLPQPDEDLGFLLLGCPAPRGWWPGLLGRYKITRRSLIARWICTIYEFHSLHLERLLLFSTYEKTKKSKKEN